MTKCAYCDEKLTGEIHAVEGLLFCCKECAVLYKQDIITAAAIVEATEWYDMNAETVMAEDIGIDDEDELTECSWCEEEYEESELKQTNLGLLCSNCIDAIRSRGEKVWVRS